MTAARVKVAPGIYRLPSGAYQAQVMVGGIRMSETYPTEKQATAWRSGIAARAEKGDRLARRGAMTFGAFWSEFDRTRRKPATRAKQTAWWESRIAPRWGRVAMRSVTGPALDVWAVELERDGLAESTIRTIVYVVSAMYREAKRHRYVETNPVGDMDRRPDLAPTPGRVVSDEEFDRMLAAVDPHPGKPLTAHRAGEVAKLRGMLAVMRETGARIGEAASLTARGVREDRIVFSSHVDPTGAGILPGLKSSRSGAAATMTREAPYTAFLREHLEPLLEGLAPGDLVFPATRTGGPMDLHNFRRVWGKILDRADLADPQPRPHDLRRTFATALGDEGVAVHKLRDALGHRDTRSIETYLRTAPASLPVEVAAVMDARRANAARERLHAVS